jgi:competence protein ComEC
MALFAFVFLLVSSLERWRDRFHSGVLRVTFLDVGQGDAAVLRFDRGSVWLIDAGGGWKDWDRGREIYAELARWGIGTIDVALLSHPDSDHGLGFRGLWPLVSIREFWWNAVFARDAVPLLDALRSLALTAGTRSVAVSRQGSVDVDGAHLHWWPMAGGKSTNDRPLVVLAEFAGCRFLFAGDAEKKTEKRLFTSAFLPVDILKVHHHGSRSSSSLEFVAKANPTWAVASSGLGNRYGHPSGAVVGRFARHGARWLGTDSHGFVEFTVRPDSSVECRSAAGPCGRMRCGSAAVDLGFAQLQ